MCPLVSVVVTSFNHAEYIHKALDSVYRQTYKNIEVIVVDDASIDGSQTIIKGYQKKYGLTFIERESNYYSAVNKSGEKPIIQAMLSAKGKYIAVVDSDDYIFPDKIKIQVDMLEKNPSASLCYGGIQLVLPDNTRKKYIAHFPSGDLFNTLLVNGNHLLYIGCLIRRTSFMSIKRSHPLLLQEDWDMFLRLAKCGPILADKRTVACYRRHGNNTWFRNDRELMMYRNRMMILDIWQHEPAWVQAMNIRWKEYRTQDKLNADDLKILLSERPEDALLHFLQYRVWLKFGEQTKAEESLSQALVFCDNRLAVLAELYQLMIGYIHDDKYKKILLDSAKIRLSDRI